MANIVVKMCRELIVLHLGRLWVLWVVSFSCPYSRSRSHSRCSVLVLRRRLSASCRLLCFHSTQFRCRRILFMRFVNLLFLLPAAPSSPSLIFYFILRFIYVFLVVYVTRREVEVLWNANLGQSCKIMCRHKKKLKRTQTRSRSRRIDSKSWFFLIRFALFLSRRFLQIIALPRLASPRLSWKISNGLIAIMPPVALHDVSYLAAGLAIQWEEPGPWESGAGVVSSSRSWPPDLHILILASFPSQTVHRHCWAWSNSTIPRLRTDFHQSQRRRLKRETSKQ